MKDKEEAVNTAVAVYMWHGNHARNIISVYAGDAAVEQRIRVIDEYKPPHEQPLRKRLLHRVLGQLPAAVLEAGAGFVKARAAYDKAWAAYGQALAAYKKARAAYDQALRDHAPELEALHRQECPDCPWDGQTIFPNE